PRRRRARAARRARRAAGRDRRAAAAGAPRARARCAVVGGRRRPARRGLRAGARPAGAGGPHVRLEGWSIDGYGVLRDYTVEGLSPGLTVLLGPNEAGKSTLLAFIRGVLFGFPDRRRREPQYAPRGGGAHGGRLFLRGPAGLHVLERDAGRRGPARLTLPDGTLAGEDELAGLLGGADRALFRSVFAFNLGELQSFESLTEDG